MALPIAEQILLDIAAPPVLTGFWWIFSRGWAGAVQGGKVSTRTKLRQNKGVWIVLVMLYLIMFGATVYFNLVGRP
jgi:hypothetical protein